MRVPTSLRFTVPLILLGFAATLSAVNLLYHVPQAEREAEEEGRKRLAQEMSRLQSTLEYLLLKGDLVAAQHEIAVLAHNHDVLVAALTDDRRTVIATTKLAWLGRQLDEVLPDVAAHRAGPASRGIGLRIESNGDELLGHASVLMGGTREELRPSRAGTVFLEYDLKGYKAEARALVVKQSLYWAGWVTALALAIWLLFHYILTRRTQRLVHAAERIASGDLTARSTLSGNDELGRLGRAFDAMALQVSETTTRLRRDIEARARVQRELENSEAALRASEEQYHAMFNASIDGLALWDDSGNLVDTNPALWRMHGYAERAPAPAVRFGSAGPSYDPRFLRAVAAGECLHAEIVQQRQDGATIDVELHGIPMQYQGKPHVLTIARDITEKKRAGEELARQRESLYQREKLAALGSLLAGVAHELNNPLSVVVARAVLLEEQGDPSTQAAALKIRTAAERCARIVRTFLAMARQQQRQRGPVAMNDVVLAALDIAAYPVRTSSIVVALDLADDIPPLRADADQLHQVLLNLIVNAQQSLQDQPGPRKLRIASRYDARANAIRITVADNGPGIPPSVRARIFEPYFTTKPMGVGTGVGLAVSLGIVEAHGGTLSVDCPPEGGAVFTITLPVGDVEAVTSLDATIPGRPVAPRRSVLVVDDEPDIREALSEILAFAQHRVTTASSGHEALQRLAGERYDVILTDVRMPDLDGRALYQEIEKRWPGLRSRVVFVTGDTLASSLRDFVTQSGRPVLEKPFLPSEVRRVVADIAASAETAASSRG
jgi:two-component system NtrC family sensor kinase